MALVILGTTFDRLDIEQVWNPRVVTPKCCFQRVSVFMPERTQQSPDQHLFAQNGCNIYVHIHFFVYIYIYTYTFFLLEGDGFDLDLCSPFFLLEGGVGCTNLSLQFETS